MYTLLELESKTFGELKKIGYELNVLPKGDRRFRQSWIDALVNVNPPLLQLLEDSPAVSVEQAQETIEPVVEDSPVASVDPVSEAIEVQAQEAPTESKFGRIVYPRPTKEVIAEAAETSTGVEVDLIEAQLQVEAQLQEPLLESSPEACDCPFCGAQHGLFVDKDHLDKRVIRCLHCSYSRFKNYPGAIRTLAQEAVLVSKFNRTVYPQLAANPVMGTIETSSGVDLDDELPECSTCFGDGYVEDEFGFVKFCQCETEPILSHKKTQRAIGLAAKNFPGSGSKVSMAHQLLQLFKSSSHIIENFPGVKTQETESESEIAPATKNHLGEESYRNPILTGLALSANFLARYSPPQPKNIHYKADIDGQLSLLKFEVESVDEPPDPDDFESLDAFREAITRWNQEPPSRSDRCSDLLQNSVHSEPNSVHSEPPDPDDFDSMFAFWAAYDAWDEASDDDSEPLEISLDSFCEWAPCDRRLLNDQLNEFLIKNDVLTGTVRGTSATSVPPGCDLRANHNGASSDRQDERLAVQKGDRLLEKKGADSGDTGRVVSRQPAQLAPQAPTQPAEKSPGVGCKSEFNIGMLVGRRSDRQHIGKILNIYQSRRGIWRAKIQPLNKSNFVYFDCATLIEQRLLYDYEMRPGGFVLTGEIFNKARCENFEVFSRKVRSPAVTNWTADELNSLSIFKLKQIARDMQIQAIPGTVGKRSLIRAILAEQAILQERRTAQLDRETGRASAQKQKSAPPANKIANKRKRAGASPLGNQLSLFDVAV